MMGENTELREARAALREVVDHHLDFEDGYYPTGGDNYDFVHILFCDYHAAAILARLTELENILGMCRQGYANQVEFGVIPDGYVSTNEVIIQCIDDALGEESRQSFATEDDLRLRIAELEASLRKMKLDYESAEAFAEETYQEKMAEIGAADLRLRIAGLERVLSVMHDVSERAYHLIHRLEITTETENMLGDLSVAIALHDELTGEESRQSFATEDDNE